MKFCSECGSKTTTQWIEVEGRDRIVCTACGRVHYLNPKVIVLCAVTCMNSLLMCLRAQEPARGKWTLPCGFLECGETLEAAAARETLEETGVHLQPGELHLYRITSMPSINQVAIGFRVDLAHRPALVRSSESLDVAFIPFEDINTSLVAWSEQAGDEIRQSLDEFRARRFGIHVGCLGDGAAARRSRRYDIVGEVEDIRKQSKAIGT